MWSFRPHGGLGVWSWGKDASTTTDEAGRMAVTLPFETPGTSYAVRVYAINDAAFVLPRTVVDSDAFFAEPTLGDGTPDHRTVSGPGQAQDFGFTFSGEPAAQFNVAETVRRGFAYVAARRDPTQTDPLPRATVQIADVESSTWYNAPLSTIVLLPTARTQDLIVLHEYAHFAQSKISKLPWIVSRHSSCTATDPFGADIRSPELAWMEGFADFFALAVAASDPMARLTGSADAFNSTPSDLEPQPACDRPRGTPGNAIEGNVAAMLWDVFDRPTDPSSRVEPNDAIERLDTQIVQILDRELGAAPGDPTTTGFFSAWDARGLPQAALRSVHNGVLAPALGQEQPTRPSEQVCDRKPWTPGCHP